MTNAISRALDMAFAMGWEILWPLILGFALSAVVQAVVSTSRDEQAAARRQPAVDRQSSRAGRGILVLLLRCGRVGTLAISQGRQLHGRDGLRNGLDQHGA